jgi:predicted dehydrogenase
MPDRRDFLRTTAAALGAAALPGEGGAARSPLPAPRSPSEAYPLAPDPLEVVRIGFVGCGGMGNVHLDNLLQLEGVEIRAVGDIVPEKVRAAQDKVEQAGFRRPDAYDRGPRDYERMCERPDLDLVYNATPWEWHVPICVAAMRAGKHAATEVPAAYTLDGCWELVETAERTRRQCVMMENCNYDRPEMLLLNLVRQGLLGELLHGEAGYLHDLRDIKFAREGEGLWRRAHAQRRNGNLYPTHGLGPIAQCMDINRGDRFEYVVSMSSPTRGLELYAAEHFPEGDARRAERFRLGDVNTALIKTARGRTIYLAHNCDNPRPYSRINMLQGTRGLFQGYPHRIHLEGRSPAHRWEDAEGYYAEFDHPLWRSERVRRASGGHGGMDFLEDYRLVECLRAGTPLDMNVYDAAALSSLCEATERSVAARSRPVDIPDFTRGRWKTQPPLPIVGA